MIEAKRETQSDSKRDLIHVHTHRHEYIHAGENGGNHESVMCTSVAWIFLSHCLTHTHGVRPWQ